MHIYDYSRKITTRSNKGPYGRYKAMYLPLESNGTID